MYHPISLYFGLFLFALTAIPVNAQSWTAQAQGALPEDYGVYGLSIVDENVVWAVAFNRPATGNSVPLDHLTLVLRTTDGGQNWDTYEVTEAVGRLSFDIHALDAQTALITTQDFGSGQGRGVFKTTDGGASWTETYRSNDGGVWIRFFNAQEGIVINRSLMATTADGGDNWESIAFETPPPFRTEEFTLIKSGNNSCQVIGNHIWFGTGDGRVFHSPDRGLNWTAADTGLADMGIVAAVAFRDTLNGIALASSNNTSGFARTTDGGNSWSVFTPSTNVFMDNFTYLPGTNGVLVGAADGFTTPARNGSAYSLDFGESWERVTAGQTYGVLSFLDANTGWIAKFQIFNEDEPALYKWEGDIFVSTGSPNSIPDLKLFPNPFRQELWIRSAEELDTYRLLGTDGSTIRAGSLQSATSIPNLSDLPPGVYLLQISLRDGQRSVRKVIKTR